ncbi:tripartite motif-containing protein 16-like [Rhinichthys klamathensis goyatoka]|uniref:tripartite motif-containing protein 16-like n=1 Tax=Rhinichthys klamathensis goyatoka TaxID=3034132 RepID=UPI0024B5BE5F|nr:tripartite motif-containing protein 16-like [Rhinichthys klamathensis goyatoka]
MAESSISVAQNQFNCSVCLDLLKNPVTIPCGHSYCMNCITGCWDQDDQKGVYSCPQCRQTFTTRPVLGKNTMLAEVVENLRKRKLHNDQLDHYYAEHGVVGCDVCTGDKNKAIKSCLVCLESYCQTHFERHEEFHSRKRHKMTDAIERLQEMICPQHDRLLEMFCRTDQICVCMLCMANEHKTHDTVSPAEERTEKQNRLEETKRKFQQRIEERQKELEELREAVESHKRSAQAAVEESESIFTELIRSIERSRSEVTQLIRDQEKILISQTKTLLERLEQEIEDLRRRDAELEQLSHTDHHIHFLQSFQSLSVPPGSTDSSSITVSSRLSFDDLRTFVSQLQEKLQHTFEEEKEKLCRIVRYIEVIPTPEYESRNEFLQYYQRFTLNSDSAHKYLRLSELNRVVTNIKKVQRHPNHPDRFSHLCQVLCRESVCGRCYWEVEWSGIVDITVSYKSIKRKGWGDDYEFGCNNLSWCLICSESGCSFGHNYKLTELPLDSISSRIGVYVDHSAGTLSYYSVSDTMTLIHRVHTTFTQPLYPAFLICYNSEVTFCDSA